LYMFALGLELNEAEWLNYYVFIVIIIIMYC
jgi:hypothetical protein